jgi:hypothetical protein
MLKVVIASPAVKDLTGKAKVSGKDYHIRIQTAYLFPVSPTGEISEMPDKFEFFLEDGQAPYPKGTYTLLPSALQVSRDGKMTFFPRLAPVTASAK